MVDHINKSCRNDQVHLDDHDSNDVKGPAMKPSSALLGPAYIHFKTKAMFPVILVVAAQAFFSLYDKVHAQAMRYFIETMSIPSTMDTYTIFLSLVAATLTLVACYFVFVPGPTLLLDFACLKPDDSTKVSKKMYMEKARKTGFFTEKSLDFMEKVLYLSGLGDETYAPPSTLSEPVDRSFNACHMEAQATIFGVTDELFAKGTVKPQEVDILIVNCSMYSPVPSLAAIVINHYKMRKDIQVFNLGGMGCSAGLIAIDLADKMLKLKRNAYALVVSTEVLSAMLGYAGNSRFMMVGNTLFRNGAAAVLLSNRRADRWRAKYELQHLVRTHYGADDASFKCVHSTQDDQGHIGISLSKDLMKVAGHVLKDNITTLAPKILPWSEKIKFAINFVHIKLNSSQKPPIKPYVPNLKKAVSHFAFHPGGRALLDSVAENLGLNDWHMEPSRMTLHRFGNTSSSSVWYVLAYLEAKNRVKQGDRVWQIALGSGFKCNSAIWRSLRPSQEGPSTNCWSEFIDKYPMEIVTTLPTHLTKVESAN